MMKTRYRLKTPGLAILDMPGYEPILVTLPADAVLEPSDRPALSSGWQAVYWEGRHYSLYKRSLDQKTERVSAA